MRCDAARKRGRHGVVPQFEISDGRMRKHHQVREGQIVRVIDGPFAGFRGEVKEVDQQTANVAIQVYGRVTPMDLALGQIELVPENLD